MFKRMMIFVLFMVVLSACGLSADYTTEEFEEAVKNGEDVSGKTVLVEVVDVEENPVFGYIVRAGNHLHFANSINPKVEEGDTLLVEVEDYVNFFGEYTIPYKEVKD